MMDPVPDGVSTVPPEVRSPSVGQKRPSDNGEDDAQLVVSSPKKPRNYQVMSVNTKKVAELVLVLATMGKMRSEKNPTAAEVDLMAEAKEKLTQICLGFSPKEVFPSNSFGAVIEDLGLKEQQSSLGPPKMSIAENLLHTKHKMEMAEEFTLHSAPFTPQHPQTSSGPGDQSRASFQPASSPLGNIVAVKDTISPSLPHPPTSDFRVPTIVSTGLPISHLGRVSSSRSNFGLDGRSNGASYAPQLQANPSGDRTAVRTASWSVQPQSDNYLYTHNAVKIVGTPNMSTSKPYIAQTPSSNQPTIRPNFPGRNFVQAPHPSNTHTEIGRIIHKLLRPHIPKQNMWTPPSRDYMNKAVTCQMCKHSISEIDSLLVCDSCEKSCHIKCLQWNNPKPIPRGDWHCGKCLALNGGKPLPTKYGRVVRSSINPPNVSENAAQSDVGTSQDKVNQQRAVANGSSGNTADTTGTQENNGGNFIRTSPAKTTEAASDSPAENGSAVDQTRVPDGQETPSGDLGSSWHHAKIMVKDHNEDNTCTQTSGVHNVEWIGDIYEVVGEKSHYRSCCISGVEYKVDDHALFRSNHRLMPSKIHAMWEDNKTRLKWVSVNRCYLPEDLPAGVGRPCAPESDEVYDSNHESRMMAKLIEGPCKVLHSNRYIEECQRRSHLQPQDSRKLHPLFLCKWFYDETKGLFRDVSC
jgi:hypothetical protein